MNANVYFLSFLWRARNTWPSERALSSCRAWESSLFSESRAPSQKGLTARNVSVAGLLRGSQKMTDRKSTLEFVIHVFKLKRGPENLVRGQEANKVRQLLAEWQSSHLGLDHLGSLLYHYNSLSIQISTH